ncbi:hypothetical protein [Colwellia psychrerythraea]|uniref:Lipoprotein n=1 Tax=Colwellia psychrerythraea TaxID=28229 RepID=A0A099K7S5_COLPS|nr:hypothetical protein [Colwellia psychrerythraea]KGJ86834.1 hypothetical protein GAB14E_4661 [Colwellia psychrerythraea]
MTYRKLFSFIIIFTLISCSNFNTRPPKKNINSVISTPIFGWFDGSCFATKEGKLIPGMDIFVVELGGEQNVSSAKIIGPDNVQICRSLSIERRKQNQSEGLEFYQVEFEPKQSIGLAIGIVGNKPKFSIVDGMVLSDFNDDGFVERFTLCATSEGISFDIWNSIPYEKDPIWSGYYYLGYDVERNCP